MAMEKAWPRRQWSVLFSCLCIVVQVLFFEAGSFVESQEGSKGSIKSGSFPPVRLRRLDHGHVVMDNGIVNVTLSTPEGMVTGIQYGGIDNLLINDKEHNRGYWDIVWSSYQNPGRQDKLLGTNYTIVTEDQNQVELSFLSTWDNSLGHAGRPLIVDKRFIMLRGSSGFYTYAIFERPEGWPAMNVAQGRVGFKLSPKLFNHMTVSDTRRRFMPTMYDRIKGQQLSYPEAVRLETSDKSDLKGEVDDKYQYSAEIKDNRVHGWISFSPGVGFWVITPSNEFRIGGPLKQELSSHVGPTSLAVFFSNHYAGTVSPKFEEGEAWKKVFGPVFIYLNSANSPHVDPRTVLWNDAKQQMVKESENWPYEFPLSKDYPRANQRGTVSGRLLVRDRYVNKSLFNANSAYVGLAKPGDVTSWQYESKGYQFWTEADNEGNFVLKNVRAGNYSLFAWVPGVIGDYKYDIQVNVEPGSDIKLGGLIYNSPRSGPTLWEIGIPDRTAAEFYVPDPYPQFVNHLFLNSSEKFRQYGLWDRYSDLYPRDDLVYNVGSSNYQKDWFFAQVTRKTNNGTYQPTTWRILFDLRKVMLGDYTLRVALASSSTAELQIRINNPQTTRPHFTTMLIGKDNAIARHGIHGLYSLYNVVVPSSLLLRGRNTFYLRQSRGGSPFTGLMYDYIRLEGPPPHTI